MKPSLSAAVGALGSALKSLRAALRPSAPATPPAPTPPSEPTPPPPRPAPIADFGAEPPTTAPSFGPLGDALAALRAGGRALSLFDPSPYLTRPWRRDTPAPEIPDGARWEWHTHVCPAGKRDYRLYVPASAAARPQGLVVMLHGCRQTADDFALGTRMNAVAEAEGFLVAYPQQARTANPNGCWNWYRQADQMRHGGEPAIIAGLTRELLEKHALAPRKAFIAGLSAGGAMTAILIHTHPELYAAAAIHSGVAYGMASSVRTAMAVMKGPTSPPTTAPRPSIDRVPTIVFQGDADPTVHPSNAEALLATMMPTTPTTTRIAHRTIAGRVSTVTTVVEPDGTLAVEVWRVAGGGHAWFGGDPRGSYADPGAPDASKEAMRFFLAARSRA